MGVDLDRAGLVITKAQAQVLANLLWEGKHTGTTLPDCEPPERVALIAVGEMVPPFTTWAKNRDGSSTRGSWTDGPLPIPDVEHPAAHTLGVVADDGRTWQIVLAGICWPDAATAAALVAPAEPA